MYGPSPPLSSSAPPQRGETALHEQVVPARSVLIGEQYRLAVRANPHPQSRGLELHQGQQAVYRRLAGHQRGEDPPEA